jgi:hypothetical protein
MQVKILFTIVLWMIACVSMQAQTNTTFGLDAALVTCHRTAVRERG